MPKIVWLNQNEVMEAQIPERGFMSFGRSSENDIVLDDPQVGLKHARLVAGPHGCLMKDQSNCRSLLVNGEPVNSRFLQNGDIIRIGNQIMEYLAEESRRYSPRANITSPSGIKFDIATGKETKADSDGTNQKKRAFLRYIAGPSKGYIQTVDRPLLPIGNCDTCYAAVSQRPNGYFLLNLGKYSFPLVNQVTVHGSGTELQDGDIITLGENRIEVKMFDSNQA